MPATKTNKTRTPPASEKNDSRSPEERERIWHNTRRPPKPASTNQKRRIFLVSGGEKTLRSGTTRLESTRRNICEEVDELMSGSDIEEGDDQDHPILQDVQDIEDPVLQDAQDIEDQVLPVEGSSPPSPSPPEPNQQHEERRRAETEAVSESESEILFSSTVGSRKRANSNPPAGEPAARRGEMASTAPPVPGLAEISKLLDDKLKDVARVDDVSQAMRAMTERVESNENMIRELGAKLNEMERRQREQRTPPRGGSNDRRKPEIPRSPSIYLAGARSLAQEDARVNEFELARRSMRIWPIAGETEEDIRKNLEDFFRGALMMARHEVDFLSIRESRRAKATDSAHVYDEVVVEFDCPADRDEIYRKAGKLAPYRDDNNKPTAGFRQQIPQFLMSAHKLLTETGFQLKRQHGPTLRWYIKYDEENYGLYLEVKLPGTYSWQRVSLQMAREMREEAGRSEVMATTHLGPETSRGSVNHTPLGTKNNIRTGPSRSSVEENRINEPPPGPLSGRAPQGATVGENESDRARRGNESTTGRDGGRDRTGGGPRQIWRPMARRT